MQPSVLELACLKTSQGRENERKVEREEGGGGICTDTTPHGALCERVKVCVQDCVGKEDCQCVNL